jgi:putative nucleotidyltransferase with HDIG domain
MENKVEEIEQYARNVFSNNGMDWFVKLHVEYVEKLALRLADIKHADKTILKLAAWLHDIGHKPKNDSDRHHIENSAFAAKLLTERGFDERIVKSVEHCILTHRCGDDHKPETLEAQILASADAMSHMENFSMLLYIAFVLERYDLEKAYSWLSTKIDRDWNSKILLPEGKEIIKDKYEEVLKLLEGMKEEL